MITTRRESTCSLKKRCPYDGSTPNLKDGLSIKERLMCKYCVEPYSEEWNHKGACANAPDCFRTCIETISGIKCAECMLYHCMKDSEGDSPQPCQCSKEPGCTRRWLGLALLSLLVPCLWCYPPLKACHWICVSCGVCGGKHQPHIEKKIMKENM